MIFHKLKIKVFEIFMSDLLVVANRKLSLLVNICNHHYRPPEGGRLYDMKVVSAYEFLRTYYF